MKRMAARKIGIDMRYYSGTWALAVILSRIPVGVLVVVFGAWVLFHHTETPTEQHERLYKSSVPGSTITVVGPVECWNEAKRLGVWWTKPQRQSLEKFGTYGHTVLIKDNSWSGSSEWYPNEKGQLVKTVCQVATNDGPRKPYIETVDN